MHKIFYASGFLYHSPTQQILLQQHSSASPWLLLTRLYTVKEKPEEVFKNEIFDLLHIKILTVHPVYSYFNENTSTHHVIVYSELKKLQNFSSRNGLSFTWFSFKDVVKLHVAEQAKHDIVVGQRVIDAVARKSRGEHAFQ